jgi:hypothetical protein
VVRVGVLDRAAADATGKMETPVPEPEGRKADERRTGFRRGCRPQGTSDSLRRGRHTDCDGADREVTRLTAARYQDLFGRKEFLTEVSLRGSSW